MLSKKIYNILRNGKMTAENRRRIYMIRKTTITAAVSIAALLGSFATPAYADDIELSVENNSSLTKETGIELAGARLVADNIEEFYLKTGIAYTIDRVNIRKSPNGEILKTVEAGTKIAVKSYDGDWAKTDKGYIYAGLITEQYGSKWQIYADGRESMKYEGLCYSYLENLPDPIEKLAESTTVYLAESQDMIQNRNPSFPDATCGYAEIYHDHSDITVWANTVYLQKLLLHELGHVLDYSVLSAGQYSNTKEWEIAWQDEAENVYEHLSRSKHNCGNTEEYFAEAVGLYLTDKGELEEYAPDTCKIMEQLLKK